MQTGRRARPGATRTKNDRKAIHLENIVPTNLHPSEFDSRECARLEKMEEKRLSRKKEKNSQKKYIGNLIKHVFTVRVRSSDSAVSVLVEREQL